MNCIEVRELLSSYYDGKLSSEDREQVGGHVGNCPECSAELARFRQLSGMVQSLPKTVPPELGWRPLQEQLAGTSAIKPAERTRIARRSSWLRWVIGPGSRPALAGAALVLVAVGWLAFGTWFAHHSHRLLAADMQQFVNEFQRDPQAAQQVLHAKYGGQSVDLNDAAQRVNHQPAVAAEFPDEYQVDSIYLLKMPCCDCLQTVCRRSDGSQFAIFEFGQTHPVSGEHRPGGMAHCRGENCCMVQISGQFAASWKKGERHIAIVGMRDQTEVVNLKARLK